MLRLTFVFLLGLLVGVLASGGLTAAAPVPASFPVQRFNPAILGRSQAIAQGIELPSRFTVKAFYSNWFADMVPLQKNVLAQGVNYVDLLATIEVMAGAWERASPGRVVSDEGMKNL